MFKRSVYIKNLDGGWPASIMLEADCGMGKEDDTVCGPHQMTTQEGNADLGMLDGGPDGGRDG